MVLFIFLNNYIALETFIITEHHFITLSFSFVATYYPFKGGWTDKLDILYDRLRHYRGLATELN